MNSCPFLSPVHHMVWGKKKVLTFCFYSSTFISIHEYANPTVPVAITMWSPTGRCQHCQGRKKKANALPVAGSVDVCVHLKQMLLYIYDPSDCCLRALGIKLVPQHHTYTIKHTHLCPRSFTHHSKDRVLKDLWTTSTDLKLQGKTQSTVTTNLSCDSEE